jgi:uncharacterized repeat protein (TIGR03803 family)
MFAEALMKEDYSMRGMRFSVVLSVTLAILTVTLFVTGTYAASPEAVLHNFNSNGKGGNYPQAGLSFDAAGNLYGTTDSGGAYNQGTLFELTPRAGGGWTKKVLHNFNANGKDGYEPNASLILDTAGNLYGTTYAGGAYDCGTVFELTRQVGGVWVEKILHSFNGGDGINPLASLIFDAAGNLYGTTTLGGDYIEGTAFELMPQGGGVWAEKILHNFNRNGADGDNPFASLIFDAAGSLYGTTYVGGADGGGTVFKLTPKAAGVWTEKILHDFNNNSKDGFYPVASLIFDAAGNLYGTTVNGGAHGGGTVFELVPKSGGGWTEKVLYSFNTNGRDGTYPNASLIFNAAGNLYSTTYAGGAHNDGTVFELTPKVGGSWTEKVLHTFNNLGRGGYKPYASLILDAAGNLYGTTSQGGAHGGGTVFKITP